MRPSEDIARKWFRAALRPGTGREVLAQIIADNTDCDNDYVEVWSDRYPAPLHIEPHGDSGCGLRIVASNGMNILCLGVSCGIVTAFLEHCIKLVNEDAERRHVCGNCTWMDSSNNMCLIGKVKMSPALKPPLACSAFIEREPKGDNA